MVTHQNSIYFKQQSDHDLTELSWLTQSDIFDRSSSSNLKRSISNLNENLLNYFTDKHLNLIDSSDSEHDNDSSSLNSSNERVIKTTTADIISPPHSALCFWILFAIEDSKYRALTLNEICFWIEHHIEQSIKNRHNSIDEQSIHSARLKSKIRYHMTKQISYFIKIIKHPKNGTKLRYPLWTIDRSKRSILLDTLLNMNIRQLSLTTPYTINLFERLCTERRQDLIRHTNDENSCPLKITISDKIIHSSEEININTSHKRRKQRCKNDSLTTSSTIPSVEVVDAAITLLLLRQPK